MGLLEQMMAKLDYLTSLVEGKGDVAVTIHNGQVKEVVVPFDANAPIDDNVKDAPTVELDKNGIPWDERIHAGTKRKNADQTWSMKKGVDKDLYAEIMTELTAAAAGKSDPVVEQKPAPTPPVKAASTKPAPTPPGKHVPPQKPEAAGDTTKAARAANTLVNDFKVDYDDIVATLLKPLGVDAFGSLTIEQAGEVLKGLEAWVKSLTSLKEEFDHITKMAEGTEHVATIAEGLTDFVSTHGGKDGVIGSVPYSSELEKNNLHKLLLEVAEWANQWEEFFNAPR